MQLVDILAPGDVLSELRATTKSGVLDEICTHLSSRHPEIAPSASAVLLAREHAGSTGVGGGVALPHGTLEGLGRPIGCLARCAPGVPFEALDGQPVRLLFVLFSPASAELHLKALSRVARLMRSERLRASLLAAPDAPAMLTAAQAEDAQL